VSARSYRLAWRKGWGVPERSGYRVLAGRAELPPATISASAAWSASVAGLASALARVAKQPVLVTESYRGFVSQTGLGRPAPNVAVGSNAAVAFALPHRRPTAGLNHLRFAVVELGPHSGLNGRTRASITLPPCSPASRMLRAGFAGGLPARSRSGLASANTGMRARGQGAPVTFRYSSNYRPHT
jgi:hypothetical protein